MSIRTFIFCDVCNPQAVRTIEYRRSPRADIRPGRRVSDGRSWTESPLELAIKKEGWLRTADGRHICPICQKLGNDS